MKLNETNLYTLMHIAEDAIMNKTADDAFEIDDIQWGDDRFYLPIFDRRDDSMEHRFCGMELSVATFKFFLDEDETLAENKKRLNEELDEFFRETKHYIKWKRNRK